MTHPYHAKTRACSGCGDRSEITDDRRQRFYCEKCMAAGVNKDFNRRTIDMDKVRGLLPPFVPGDEFGYPSAAFRWGLGIAQAMARVNTLVHYELVEVVGPGRFRVRGERT